MTKITTTPYDVAEHLRTPEESAAYLEACLEEANGDAAFIAKALGDIARQKGCLKLHTRQVFHEKVLTKFCQAKRTQTLISS